ncbi:short-chain alcohol dehydrogenase (plasmid) [Aromatoleum aromaticum EbN1]|uniref:Short-chain alcohol dehydrogenase n=1 Tax=Aromatoleum aromaticum (strain DSM 19018 / LMG 30748 / EbN1) TaxID=76114 RepID=Q5NW77_AROAE|nr:glucose 1-dehydrogenase [Aromatoleum aromaticum]CAI10687.1 short-chain alcohol dehydrogenase [Aromatoleum aromaticum EbN1]
MRLEKKIAIVTGAASGIGQATALRLAKEGAHVACFDFKSLDSTMKAIEAAGGNASAFQGDVKRASDWAEMVKQTVERFGRVDVLANIAGVVSIGSDNILDQTEEGWDRIMDINVKGTWLGMKEVMPVMMKNGGGKIVNVASLAAHVGLTNLAAYSASKGAVVALTRYAAMEYAKDNIQVNAVSPGIIQTPILGDTTPEMTKLFSADTPAGRLGRPEEIANMVLFLASDEADFITGITHIVDGGWGSH